MKKKSKKCPHSVIIKASLWGHNKMWYCKVVACFKKGERHEFPEGSKEEIPVEKW